MLCIPITGPSIQAALKQIAEANTQADLLELRLDYFESPPVETAKRLQASTSLPLIFTLRSLAQGGKYTGSEEMRLATIQDLASLKPAYLDLEYHTPPSFIASLSRQFPTLKLILSYHNFTETPADLEAILTSLRHVPCHLYKIACTACSTLDSLRMVLFARTHAPLLGICMGPLGQVTRILATPWTYASLHEDAQTAPGQIPARELKTLYPANPHSRLYGLIGSPVSHSIGHQFHNITMQQQGIDGVYVKMELHPEELPHFFGLARALPFYGLSVTMPLKCLVIPFLDTLDEHARQIGAVNTICQRDGKLVGFNTDGNGGLDALERHMKVMGKKVVVLGSGGAARAIIYETLRRGAEVLILNRTQTKALQLAHELGAEAGDLATFNAPYDILVNTSPITPIPLSAIRPHTLVVDINHTPSPLLTHARSLGCPTVDGREMFLNQAAAQQVLWHQTKVAVA